MVVLSRFVRYNCEGRLSLISKVIERSVYIDRGT